MFAHQENHADAIQDGCNALQQ